MDVATYVTVPVFMVLIVGFATQLEDIAKDTSSKALAFSDDMNKAMDCATQGIPISECSPDLMRHDFTKEREEFLSVLDDMQRQLNDTVVVNSTQDEPADPQII